MPYYVRFLFRQPMFLNEFSVEPIGSSGERKTPSTEHEQTTFGLKLASSGKLAAATIMLEALSVNDRTLWTTKLNEAVNSFREQSLMDHSREQVGQSTTTTSINLSRSGDPFDR